MIQDRLENYTEALQNAKSAGDSSKQRRADRGLKVNIAAKHTCIVKEGNANKLSHYYWIKFCWMNIGSKVAQSST